jgi:acetolactate synthase-1/2/3 large subunit
MGVFMMQNGPGAENGFGGVAQAYSESVPILLLPAGMPREKRGVHPNFYPTRSYETITKWSEEMNIVERIPDLMRRAFTKLRTGRPGPVLLEIPADVATAELPEELFNYEPPRVVLQQADPADVSRAAKALLAADRPILRAGQGVLYAEATQELIEIAEFLQAPVMTTLPGKSAFPETHPLALGSGGPSTTGMVDKYLKGSDLIFGVGCSFTKTNFAQAIPQGKTIIHMTNDEDAIGREYKTEYAMLGDAKLVLRQLLDELKSQAGSARAKNQVLQDDIKSVKKSLAGPVDAQIDLRRSSHESLPCGLGPDAHGRPGQHDHHPRVRQRQGIPESLLGSPRATQLHRLGQVDPTGLQPGTGHGRQAG